MDIDYINLSGLSSYDRSKVLLSSVYLARIDDIRNDVPIPDIIVYPKRGNKYTIADGIHRFHAYISCGITSFNCSILH